MADAFIFELVSPERLFVSEKVSEVVIPAMLGEMTVLAEHAPTMTTIKPGIVSIKLASGQVNKYVVFGGFADILPNSCTLLADAAIPVAELTADTLQRRIDSTKAELDKTSGDEHKTRVEQFLTDLTQLNGIVVAA